MLYYPIFWELSQSISIAVLSISWLNKNDLQTCHQELRKELQRGTLLLGFTVSFCLQSSGSVDDVDASFLPTFHNCQARLAVASATRSQRLSCKQMQALHAWRMSAMFFRLLLCNAFCGTVSWCRFYTFLLQVSHRPSLQQYHDTELVIGDESTTQHWVQLVASLAIAKIYI